MTDPDIEEAIVTLRREIAALDPHRAEDPAGPRARLASLVDTIAERLDRASPAERDAGPVGARPLSEAVMEIVHVHEARYPRLTQALNDAASRLVGMGI